MGEQTQEHIPFIDPATISELPDSVLCQTAKKLGNLLEWIEDQSEGNLDQLSGLNQNEEYFHWFDESLKNNECIGKNGKMRIRFDEMYTLREELESRDFVIDEFPGLEHFFKNDE